MMSDRHFHCVYFQFDDSNDLGGRCLLKNEYINWEFEKCCENIVLRPEQVLSYFLKHEDYCENWECADKKAHEYIGKVGFNTYPKEVRLFERWNDHCCKVKDNQEGMLLSWEDVVDKLNEQQSTINKLKSDIEETEISIKLFEDDIATKNKKIEEQQATINKLKEENGQLKKELKWKREEIKALIEESERYE